MLKKAALILVASMGILSLAHAQSNVDTLPSGVRVEHTVKGNGPTPTVDSTVTVNYRGTFASNGAEFDSSYKRGKPTSFPLGGVIPCWRDGIQKMAVGGKAVLLCPSSTAYGARGAGGVIPPNADLRFEVELLDVK
ncbi:TPA: FKBP-type peptidyl-prolyl cis-trans isomerase [Burkholderia vietnamiensis]|nr:FKBP-type peptidyl-prolyl cis-trans isomerase [Burkholderia vietnamiensis]